MNYEVKRIVCETEEDWLQYRNGYFTASEIHRLLAEPTKKELAEGEVLSKGAKTYIYEKVAAALGGSKPHFYNSEMQWGKDTEQEAALTFCNLFGYDVNSDDVIYTSQGGTVLFVCDELGIAGTPDMILPDAILEIKCPNSATQVYNKVNVDANNLKDEYPNYYAQMQLNMLLTNRPISYFMSYDPRLQSGKVHIIEIPFDYEYMGNVLIKIQNSLKLKQYILSIL